ncbi:methyl-accepting chemotaxis protein [Fibrobacterales bacterium]|nr:methyl-accepting chemotaxis protein [Fibrobacterales bacterium]
MLSMLAILLSCSIVNGLLIYTIVNSSNENSVLEYDALLKQNENALVDSWLGIAESITSQYVSLANANPDSAEIYKVRVLNFLKNIRWNSIEKDDGYYFVFEARGGNALLFHDSLGKLIPQNKNILGIEDAEGKKFVKDIRDKAFAGDSSSTNFKYSKLCLDCAPVNRTARGIFIRDWDWVIATGLFSTETQEKSKSFSLKFGAGRLYLMQNLFGIMLLSFLAGLFLVFRQMNAFTVPLKALSNYLHKLASEGLRFEDFKLTENSQEELQKLAVDINSVVHNVGKSMEEVHVNADRVSDLSGACADMLDIVDYDAKLVGQRTSEMRIYSKDVVDNVESIATGIEEINANLDGLKKLTSRIAESSSDIKSSMSQMSDAMRELNDKSKSVQSSAISVVQAVNDLGLASAEELSKINGISDFIFDLADRLTEVTSLTADLRISFSQNISRLHNDIAKYSPESRAELKKVGDSVSQFIEELYNKMIDIQTQLPNFQDNQVIALQLVVEERRNLSKEISGEAHDLDTSIESVASRISEINSSSQYINSSIKFVSSDINEAYHNLEEIVNATDNMNDNARTVSDRMGDFSDKSKRVEEAHEAIAHTISEAKVSMKNLNDLSANLRKVVDDLMHVENQDISETREMKALL